MENKDLLVKLNRLGYPLLETANSFDVNKTLADVVNSGNSRYLEGFPVLLANAANESNFGYDKVEVLLKNKKSKETFKELFLLSLALYKTKGLYFKWANDGRLTAKEKDKLSSFKKFLDQGGEAEVGAYKLNAERVAKTFNNYFTQETAKAKDMSAKHEDLSLEFSLSQVFSPKQKDLFKKKLKNELLTKTEKEYFSRTVKKKVSALANAELHRLAQRILE
jgi:hypothetical protein